MSHILLLRHPRLLPLAHDCRLPRTIIPGYLLPAQTLLRQPRVDHHSTLAQHPKCAAMSLVTSPFGMWRDSALRQMTRIPNGRRGLPPDGGTFPFCKRGSGATNAPSVREIGGIGVLGSLRTHMSPLGRSVLSDFGIMNPHFSSPMDEHIQERFGGVFFDRPF